MKVLVTGGAGFIGKHVVKELVEHGHQAVVLDSFVPQVHGQSSDWVLEQEVRQADVRDPYAVRAALAGCDAVIHLAARVGTGQSMYEFAEYMDANVRGTSVLLDALVAEPVRKLVVASSMSIYGEGARDRLDRPMPTPESHGPHVASPYALSKYDQEQLCMIVGAAHGIPTVALRFFNVYGPGQSLSNPYTGALAIFATQLLNGVRPYIYEDGLQRRDFVYVADVARAVRMAMEDDDAGYATLNVGTGIASEISDVAYRLSVLLGSTLEPYLSGALRAGDVRHCYADATLIGDVLNWKAEWSLDRGLDELVPWLLAQQADDRTLTAHAELRQRGLLVSGIQAHAPHPAPT